MSIIINNLLNSKSRLEEVLNIKNLKKLEKKHPQIKKVKKYIHDKEHIFEVGDIWKHTGVKNSPRINIIHPGFVGENYPYAFLDKVLYDPINNYFVNKELVEETS